MCLASVYKYNNYTKMRTTDRNGRYTFKNPY